MHSKNLGNILEIPIEVFTIQVKEGWRILTKIKFTKFSS
jgi:hypothetical protein